MKNNIRNISIVFLSILFNLHGLHAQHPYWPQFRGPNASGHSLAAQHPPVTFSQNENVIWKTDIPFGHSSPCIWKDKIFLTGFDKEQQDFSVFCLDRKSGEMLWGDSIHIRKVESVHAISCPANATIATDGDKIFVYFASYGLISYDLDGHKLWERTMPVPKTTHGMGTSPIVAGALVILNCSNDANDPRIIALDKTDGKIHWKQELPLKTFRHEGYSTPVIYKDQVIIFRRGEIAGYKLQNGTKVWWIDTHTSGASTPIIVDNKLYVGTYTAMGDPESHIELPDFITLTVQNDRDKDLLLSKEEFPEDLYAIQRNDIEEFGAGKMFLKDIFEGIDENQNKLLDSTEWENTRTFIYSLYTEHGLVAYKLEGEGDISVSGFLWKQVRGVSEVPSPIHCNGNIYMIKYGGTASCMDANDGQIHFQERLRASGSYFASPIAADDKIYIPSRNGIVTVFEAGDELNILAKNDLNDILMATPAIVGNQLYIRTTDSLYAFGEQ